MDLFVTGSYEDGNKHTIPKNFLSLWMTELEVVFRITKYLHSRKQMRNYMLLEQIVTKRNKNVSKYFACSANIESVSY